MRHFRADRTWAGVVLLLGVGLVRIATAQSGGCPDENADCWVDGNTCC